MSSAIHEILQNVAACRQYFVTFMDDRANAREFEKCLAFFQTHRALRNYRNIMFAKAKLSPEHTQISHPQESTHVKIIQRIKTYFTRHFK